MKNYLRKLFLCGFLFSAGSSLNVYGDTNAPPFYQFGLVRDLSDSFENSLKLNPPLTPIDIDLARKQHESYVDVVRVLVPNTVRLEGDPNHPDCNFIEDTAIIVRDIAVISTMGAFERRGEEVPVAKALEKLGIKNLVYLQEPATMDGGDILYTGKHLVVGLSQRTNEQALQQLKEIFKDKVEVIGVRVVQGLHLKSVISLFDSETLVVAATPAGKLIQDQIQLSANGSYVFIPVPDPIASNVLRIGTTLIVQEGFPASEAILQNLCNEKLVNLIKINMSELIKADGALTCGSLLFN